MLGDGKYPESVALGEINTSNADREYLNCRKDNSQDIENDFRRILNMNFTELKACLQKTDKVDNEVEEGNYNAFTVLCAYVWRALKINPEINCITQFIGDAFEKAKALDKPRKKGPLHGMPFSVQGSMAVTGYPLTFGLGQRVGAIATDTCPMVKALEEHGAIPFCLTNVPQGLLTYVTWNPLHGATRNPWDYKRTPGGSAGGGAALLAAGGTAFAIGTDSGGGLRIPAAFCGLTTLKPSRSRLHTTQIHNAFPGRDPVGLSSGFLTRTVEEQDVLLGCIIGNETYLNHCRDSPQLPMSPLPQRQEDPLLAIRTAEQLEKEIDDPFGSSLRIGILFDNGFQNVVPSNTQAVVDTLALLKQVRVTESPSTDSTDSTDSNESTDYRYHFVNVDMEGVTGYNGAKWAEKFFKNAMSDSETAIINMYKKEPSDNDMEQFITRLKNRNSNQNFFTCLPSFVTRRTGCSNSTSRFQSDLLSVLGKAHFPDSASQNPQNPQDPQDEIAKFREIFVEYMDKKGIDAIICPAFITPAQEHNDHDLLTTGTYLTGLFNMLDFPAGIVPVGQVSVQDRSLFCHAPAFSMTAADHLVRRQFETSQKTGLPKAVQVVTRPNKEELCLQVMRLVETNTNVFVQRLRWLDNPKTKNGVLTSKERFDRVPNSLQAPLYSHVVNISGEEQKMDEMRRKIKKRREQNLQKRKLPPLRPQRVYRSAGELTRIEC